MKPVFKKKKKKNSHTGVLYNMVLAYWDTATKQKWEERWIKKEGWKTDRERGLTDKLGLKNKSKCYIILILRTKLACYSSM